MHRKLLRLLVLAFLMPGAALAHPHVMMTAGATVVTDGAGRIVAFDMHWTFDELYSAYTIQDLPPAKKPQEHAAALAKQAAEVVENLKEYAYFTDIEAGGKPVEFGTATGALAEIPDGIYGLKFRLPLKTPLDPAGKPILFRVYDPTYYIATELAPKGVVLPDKLAGRCKTAMQRASLAENKTMRLSEAAFQDAGKAGDKDRRSGIGFSFAETLEISCK